MEKIKIGKEERRYEISSIRPESANILEIVFAGAIPAIWGDITIYTNDGTEATTLHGYETVWKREESRVWLSNDGSVYTPPAPPEPAEPPEPYVPTLAEAQDNKKAEVNAACEAMIVSGVNVTLADGTVEHFDLKERDQLNLFGKQIQVNAGLESIEYHTDTTPTTNCKYYSNADMQSIIQAAMWHVSYHQTYCISLKVWIDACETKEEVAEIFYGADIPEQYQSEVLKAYLVRIAAEMGVDNGTPAS